MRTIKAAGLDYSMGAMDPAMIGSSRGQAVLDKMKKSSVSLVSQVFDLNLNLKIH